MIHHNQRTEKKYFLTQSCEDAITIISNLNQIFFYEHFPERKVTSTYFDTIDLCSYHKGISNYHPRRKIRIRWYGDQMNYIKTPLLEIKTNYGNIKYKESIPISPFNHCDIKNILTTINTVELIKYIPLIPSLYVSYYRRYFISPDHKTRITFDNNISYSLNHKTQITSHQAMSNLFLMEIKCFPSMPNLICPFKEKSFSKYIEGCKLFYH